MLLIRNATIVNELNMFMGAILIEGERIAEIFKGDKIPKGILANAEIVDAAGCFVLPGAIDAHVHFRDPGLTQKGDVATESAAAVAGGVTSFFEMPNTSPATVSIETWEAKMAHAAECSCANYAFYLGATNNNLAALQQADYTKVPGIKLFMGSSTGNMLVSETSALDSLFRFASDRGVVVAAHCEYEPMIRARREAFLRQYPSDGDLPMYFHSLIRNEEECFFSSYMAVSLANNYGTRLHLLHVSTKAELSMLDYGRYLGFKNITSETCPHYFLLAQDGDSFNWIGGEPAVHPTIGQSAFKCNPAIKSSSNRDAICQAVVTRLIDTFGSDHAPHLPKDKKGGALKAASGMPSIQFMLPLLLECWPAAFVVEMTAHNPARIFGIEGRGFIRKGYYADLVIVRPVDGWTVNRSMLMGRCGWSPYEGFTFHNQVEQTFVNGHLVYDFHHNPTQVLSGFQKSITFAR